MEISPTIHFMSVSEALAIMHRKRSVPHAVIEIFNMCNISITSASRNRNRRKLLAANLQRAEKPMVTF